MFNGRIDIEKINEQFLYQLKDTPAKYKADLDLPSPRLAGDA